MLAIGNIILDLLLLENTAQFLMLWPITKFIIYYLQNCITHIAVVVAGVATGIVM